MKKSFPAFARKDARVLILGSLPGEESLNRQQYYAKKTNRFWWIMGELIGAGPDMDYKKRLARLKKNHIASWDVCASAQRSGSLDSNIVLSSIVPNDFGSFFSTHKHIELICFNGQFASKIFHRKVLPTLQPAFASIRREILPSTSPAHAGMKPQEKLARWRKVLGEFIE